MNAITTSVVSFLTWWKHALLACLPIRLRFFLLPPEDVTLVTSYEGDFFYFHILNEKKFPTADDFIQFQNVGELGDLTYRKIILICPDAYCFELPVSIPLDEASNMHSYLEDNMHSFVPYSADNLCYKTSIIRTNPSAERIEILLRAIPKHLLDNVKNALVEIGLPIHAIALPTKHIAEFLKDLEVAQTDTKPKKHFPVAALAFMSLCLLFISEVVSINKMNTDLTALLNDLRAETRSYQKSVHEIENIKSEIESLITKQDFYIDQYNISVETLNILVELSDKIPTDTWFTEFTKDKQTITVSGYTDNAAAILNLINALPQFAAAKFASPTNFDQRLKKEKFSITFTLTKNPLGDASDV